METIIQKALKLLLDKFGSEYDCVTISEEQGHYRANIECPTPARLIGKNGEIISALQVLLKNVMYTQNKENTFVTVDVDNYRKDQENRMVAKAQNFIENMKDQNLAEIKLPPMTPYFRRVVHLWVLNNYPELNTDSVGEGRARAVKVFYK